MCATPRYIFNPGGPTLGVTSAPVLEQEGLYFKNVSRSGVLLPFEDWRRSPRNGRRIWLHGFLWKRSQV